MPDFHFGHYTMTTGRPNKLYDWVKMRPVFLRPRELAILGRLVRAEGGIVPMTALERLQNPLGAVRGVRTPSKGRTRRQPQRWLAGAGLRMSVLRLRRELGPGSIKTHWEQGYRIAWDVRVGGPLPAPRVAR